MTVRTHIVMVNWNGATDTIECLESLLRLQGDFAVTVCDNGSTDGSIDKIVAWAQGPAPAADWSQRMAHMGPRRLRQPTFRLLTTGDSVQAGPPPVITILDTGANLGFAGGNNAGIRLALADEGCAYIWLLNNDTVVDPQALLALLARMQDTAVAVCGSTLLFYDDPGTVQALGSAFDLGRALGRPIGLGVSATSLPGQAEVELQMAYVVGASLLTRREVMARTGGLCEDYFLYFEEIDLSRRLAPGEGLGWAPQSVVYHKEGGSIGTSSRGRSSPTSVYYLRVNLLRFYQRYHPALLPVAFARIAREAFLDFSNRDTPALNASALAVGDFLCGRRRVGPISFASSQKPVPHG
ncbi:glycosyltransferase family 2 protein [Brevundimonas sp. TWP2-3-2]|uniref:glycosyltransferase family 2 protein n=1 Tax=unclassified Brevundimonas TaxID=2622653 RepID=UPI003CEFB254